MFANVETWSFTVLNGVFDGEATESPQYWHAGLLLPPSVSAKNNTLIYLKECVSVVIRGKKHTHTQN